MANPGVEWDDPDDPAVYVRIEQELTGNGPAEEPAWLAAERIARLEALAREPDQLPPVGRRSLAIEDVAAVAARVRAKPPPGWLAQPVWPEDAYGLIAAESKAGKSWAALDLAVAAAGGGSWLGQYPTGEPGAVLVFLGEASERKSIRRLEAVAEFHGLVLDDLPIRVCHQVPQLRKADHLGDIHAELEQRPPRLVIVDPLYLAAGGANSASLFEMGSVFADIQFTCATHSAALVIVHHWNQTGTGKGKARMSGAGSEEWGRVLASVAVLDRRRNGNATEVDLEWEFVGDEIPETTLRLTRTVEALEPRNLGSPMTYSVTPSRLPSASWDGPTECMGAIEAVLREVGGEFTRSALIRELRQRGLNYRDATVDDSLGVLLRRGTLTRRPGSRKSHLYRLPTETEEGMF